MLKKAFKAAFPKTIPILAGFLFLGFSYGVYMNVSGFGFVYPMVMSAAIFGMLVVYCLKSVDVAGGSHGLPELISLAALSALHLWRKNMLLSIAAGTVCYMLPVQFVFV